MKFPEVLETIRCVDLVQPARGGRVVHTMMLLDDGRVVKVFDAEFDGLVVPCETRQEAFDLLRQMYAPN